MYSTPILLAVSGGIDSMVMLHQMVEAYGALDIGVAHCNFQLRGKESDDDEEFVRTRANSVGVQFYSERIDAEQYAKEHQLGIQLAAREIRYKYFDRLKNKHGYKSIATAHHQDDSIETYFINLLRGSGPDGLSGIKEDTDRGILRPLLAWDRKQIEAYARTHGIRWKEDTSNSSLKYLRNRTRLELIPLLDDMRPGWKKALKRNMEMQAEHAEILMHRVGRYRALNVTEREDGLDIQLAKTPGEVLILGHILAPYGLNFSQVKDILRSQESGSQVLNSDYSLTFHRGVLELSRRSQTQDGPWLIEDDLHCGHLPFEMQMEVLPSAPATLDQGAKVALLDMDQLRYPLKIRAWEDGDRLRPLGMKGEKKVSDLLNDRNLSVERKKKVHVLESGGDIIWVIGERIDDRYKVRPDSKAVLKVYI